jgi:hypothetical protein
MASNWYQYRWETADLTDTSNTTPTFSDAGTNLATFIYPPYVVSELLKKMLPHYVWRRYTTKITDYGKGKGDTVVYRKDMSQLKQRWAVLGEYDKLYNTNMESKFWSVQVSERGVAFPYTERLNILGYDNPIAMLENHVGVALQSNVDTDLLENAFSFLDLIYVSVQTGNVHSLVGKDTAAITAKYANQNKTTLAGTKGATSGTKYMGVSSALNYVTLTAADLTDQAADIGSTGYYKDTPTIADLKFIKSDLEAKRVPKIGKNYVAVINPSMAYYLSTDPEFNNAIIRNLSDRFVDGELGTIWGYTFVIDDSGEMDDCFYDNGDSKIPSVAIILGADAVREAVALPEQIRRDTPLDAGRFHRTAILTYRAEQPTWFSAEAEYRGCIYVGKSL